ncbi:MAG: beta-lactamase family protein [Deltaproteobacteria bacterium]|nr:beta-lactamase family protein [Deltaproteobacteria bacterium]
MRLLSLLVCAFLLGGCPSPDDDDSGTSEARFDSEITEALREALEDELPSMPAHGCTVALRHNDGSEWAAGVGLDGPEGEPLDAGAPFGVASITKTYTASMVMELVDDGLVALDESLEQHLPGVHPRGAEITVGMLLRHTAGIPGALGTTEAQADVPRAWTEDELFAFVADDPLVHGPGADYAYSNTHYMLLARIAEAATQTPWREFMEGRLLQPFGLDDTRIPALGEDWGDVTSSWIDDAPFPAAFRTHPQAIGAAGNIVSTALDVARWGKGRFATGLHSEAMKAAEREGTQIAPDIVYGLGAMVLDTDGGEEIGHNGALGGFATWVGHRTDAELTLALLCNAWGGGAQLNVGYPLGVAQETLWEAIDP